MKEESPAPKPPTSEACTQDKSIRSWGLKNKIKVGASATWDDLTSQQTYTSDHHERSPGRVLATSDPVFPQTWIPGPCSQPWVSFSPRNAVLDISHCYVLFATAYLFPLRKSISWALLRLMDINVTNQIFYFRALCQFLLKIYNYQMYGDENLLTV